MPAEQRREQLLDAALQVIVRDGYGAVSIDAVAREVGVTRPVVYGVFDGLRPLLEALLDREQERALQQLAAAFPSGPPDPGAGASPIAMAEDSARRLIEVVRANPLTWRPILTESSMLPAEVRARIDRDRENVRTQVAALVDLATGLGGGPALDAEVVAHAVVAVLEHFGRVLLEEPDRFSDERLLASLRGVLAAILPG